MDANTPPPPPPSVDALLAEMAREGGSAGQRAYVVAQAEAGHQSRRPGIQKCRYTHEDCIDRILANPGIAQNELAEIYGVSAGWMSIVVNSDAFKARMAERKAELVDPVLAATLNERFAAVAARSCEVLLEKLAKPVEEISDKLALEAANLGARVAVPVVVQGGGPLNAVDHLAAIAHRLVDLNRPRPQTIDGEIRRVD